MRASYVSSRAAVYKNRVSIGGLGLGGDSSPTTAEDSSAEDSADVVGPVRLLGSYSDSEQEGSLLVGVGRQSCGCSSFTRVPPI